ncbi:MAG: PDDEXK nuclease domain-containing protein [Saprospiraceae bacterium]
MSFPVDKDYKAFLKEVKLKIQHAQTKAIVTVNQELLYLYWDIGNEIISRQKEASWGDNVITQLSKDLKKEFPSMKGFSTRNLKYMRRFAREYPTFENRQQAVAQIGWSHNLLLIQKVKDVKERFWYAQKAVEHGWSRSMMVHHIERRLYEREGKAITNFANTLPSPQSELAQQSLKDPYIFDFLTLAKDAREKDLEDALMKHITKFLLELGAGFAFVGRQYALNIGKEDYYIDLLFYHLKLRAYVVIDLKIGKFKPADAGQINFYLSAVDDILKTENDNPSIGLVLCKDKENVVVEYALKDISKPIGISEYKLSDAIPEDLKSSLPTIKDLERELREIKQKKNK